MKLAKASITLLILHLAIVSSVAAKYLYERVRCPRVWTRTTAYDPALVMRGRYLSLRLFVDGCDSALPAASNARFGRNTGVPVGKTFNIHAPDTAWFEANLAVKDNKLVALRAPQSESSTATRTVSVPLGAGCDQEYLVAPVDFYIAEHAADPTWLKPGQELWIEVTVPPRGPPRPLQLALKNRDAWKPLAFD